MWTDGQMGDGQTGMSDKVIAWVRTVLPGLWAGLLVAVGIPGETVAALGVVGEIVVYPVVLGAVYALLQWLQTRVPTWLARVLAGSEKTPTYVDPPISEGAHARATD